MVLERDDYWVPGNVGFSPDGKLVSVAYRGRTRLFDVQTGSASAATSPAIPAPTMMMR